jgi:hypothetical protein
MNDPFVAASVLSELHDFQLASTEHAFRRLFVDADSTRRFLIADETGLGKTHVAKGVIAKTIETLQHRDDIKRIDIVYVCSNADIADQNLAKLVVTGDHRPTPAKRLTMLVADHELLTPSTDDGIKPVTFVSFTPATSFEFGWQTGKARERAVLFELLREHLDLSRPEQTALKRILLGTVSRLTRFEHYIVVVRATTGGRWEPNIQRAFLRAFDRSTLRPRALDLIERITGRKSLTLEESEECSRLIAALRQQLARQSVHALEPDLVILDEFQRFKNLLDPETEAGELAATLFDQPDAHVLLLSATPYKAFTYAEEAEAGDDHYSDLLRTLGFLANGEESVEPIRGGLADLRQHALSGESVVEVRADLERRLRKLLSRTERPSLGDDEMLSEVLVETDAVEAVDLAGYVALHRLAEALEAPLTVEYWKAGPYFANFLDGYKVGAQLKEAIKDPAQRADLRPLLRATQRLRGAEIQRFRQLDWGNARLRRLAADTVDRGWWRLLWVPPSLPYYGFGGAYATDAATGVTKRLIFSSWVAAPSAIASLLSYEAERSIHAGARRFENTPDARTAIRRRLDYRLDGNRPAAMTTLALFWPSPAIAAVTDPLDAAREVAGSTRDAASVLAWAAQQAAAVAGPSGTSSAAAATAWYWAAPLLSDGATEVGDPTAELSDSEAVDALSATSDTQGSADEPSRVLLAHIDLARRTIEGFRPDADRPPDLVDVVALLGVAAPGNVSWRALRRVAGGDVTVEGLWQAAAVLASGFRALFNRPEVILLLDQIDPQDESAYWQVVARYCFDGNLQAVIDEYVHHLAEAEGIDASDDEGLLEIAETARRALTIRPARYVALDPARPNGEGIPFLSRFALRFGNIRQDAEDVRLPEIRGAFNSPFWPFVLATTSIGQEGVDFHWWCHAIVHWNLPANPVDFEQREGRVNRYKGHAVRKNVATKYRTAALEASADDVWRELFALAAVERDPRLGDLKPYWVFAGDAKIERYVMGFPLSRDLSRWEELRDMLALYRLAYGQPRQDDMVSLLARRGIAADESRMSELRLDLRPPAFPVREANV